MAKAAHLPAPADKPAVIADAGFESVAGWNLPPAAQQVEQAHEGEHALQIAGSDHEARAVSEQFQVEAGRCYELHGWVKIGGGWSDARLGHAMWEIEFFDAAGDPLPVVGPLHDNRQGSQLSTNYYINDTFGKWQEVHYPVIVPPEARTARVAARLGAPVVPRRGRRDRAGDLNRLPLPETVALFDDVSLAPLDVRPKE